MKNNSCNYLVLLLLIFNFCNASYACSGKSSCNIPPVAIIEYEEPLRVAPVSVLFDGETSYDDDGTIVKYEWLLGPSVIGLGSKLIHNFPSGGIYRLILRVTDNAGGTNETNILVNIKYEVNGLQWARPIFETRESSSLFKIPIVLNKPLNEDLIVKIKVTGSAINFLDYDLSSDKVLIPAGSLRAYVSLRIFIDEIPERNENIDLEIDFDSISNQDISRGLYRTTSVIIFDELSGCGGIGSYRHINPDGSLGGIVSASSTVSNTSTLSAGATVCNHSNVSGNSIISGAVSILNYSNVENSTVESAAIVDGSHIYSSAYVAGGSNIKNSKVSGVGTKVLGAVTLLEASVSGGAVVKDFAKLLGKEGSGNVSVTGGIVSGNAYIETISKPNSTIFKYLAPKVSGGIVSKNSRILGGVHIKENVVVSGLGVEIIGSCLLELVLECVTVSGDANVKGHVRINSEFEVHLSGDVQLTEEVSLKNLVNSSCGYGRISLTGGVLSGRVKINNSECYYDLDGELIDKGVDIHDNVVISGEVLIISGDIQGNAIVSDEAQIIGSYIGENSEVLGKAKIISSGIRDNAIVSGRAIVIETGIFNFAQVKASARVTLSTISGHVVVTKDLINETLYYDYSLLYIQHG